VHKPDKFSPLKAKVRQANKALEIARKRRRKTGEAMAELDLLSLLEFNKKMSLSMDVEGLPIVELGKHNLLEEICAERDWPVNANLRALLKPYFKSRGIWGMRFRDEDTMAIFHEIYSVYDVLRRSEREEWDANDPSISACLYKAFEAGYPPAALHMVRFCLQTGKQIERWARDWLLGVLKDNPTGALLKMEKMEQPGGCTPKKWREDLETCVRVDFWRSKVRRISRSGKVEFILGATAFRLVRAMNFPGSFRPEETSHLETIEKAHDATVRRFSKLVILPSCINRWLAGQSIRSFRKVFPEHKKA
jgi:hypothetical protein